MYSEGEIFYHIIDDEKTKLTVLETLILSDQEYLITEDLEGSFYVFFYDEDEEALTLIDDPSEAETIVKYWQEEYLGLEEIPEWDDDYYYSKDEEFGHGDLSYDDDDDRDYY